MLFLNKEDFFIKWSQIMKWKVLALINFVWFSGYTAEGGIACSSSPVEKQIYTLQLKGEGSLKWIKILLIILNLLS